MATNNAVKIMDEELQKILVFEYFFLKKDVETLAEVFDIPSLDLKYFFYSVEAFSLYRQYEEEFKTWEIPESLDQLRNFVVDEFKRLLKKSEPDTAADLIDKAIPKIINLYNKQNTSIEQNINFIGNQQNNTLIEDNRGSYLPFQIEYVKPSLLTEEELVKISAPPGIEEAEIVEPKQLENESQ